MTKHFVYFTNMISTVNKLCILRLTYKEAKNTMQHVLKRKRKKIFLEKLEENVAEPKEFWKKLRRLDHPKTKAPSSNICFKENDGLSFCSLSIANNFK